MLIPLFFYGSEHIEKQVQIHIMTYNSIYYKNFHSIGDMLIGSIKQLQAPEQSGLLPLAGQLPCHLTSAEMNTRLSSEIYNHITDNPLTEN